jgi:hypothetical protein
MGTTRAQSTKVRVLGSKKLTTWEAIKKHKGASCYLLMFVLLILDLLAILGCFILKAPHWTLVYLSCGLFLILAVLLLMGLFTKPTATPPAKK